MKLGITGIAALNVGHVAGMIDLVALPVWVGALQERYGMSLQQSGGLVTLFLMGVVLASVTIAPRFNRVNQKAVTVVGFAFAAAAFFRASTQTVSMPLAVLHAAAGVCVGTTLSLIHRFIGRAENPHRVFAFAGIGLGLFAVVFLGGVPQIMIAFGGAALFWCFAAVMAVATVVSILFYKAPSPAPQAADRAPFPRTVWFLILGISLMPLIRRWSFPLSI